MPVAPTIIEAPVVIRAPSIVVARISVGRANAEVESHPRFPPHFVVPSNLTIFHARAVTVAIPVFGKSTRGQHRQTEDNRQSKFLQHNCLLSLSLFQMRLGGTTFQ